MSADIIIATDKPNFLTTGLRSITSAAAYDAAKPTATIPSTTSQTVLIPTNLGDKPTLLRIVPFCGSSSPVTSVNFTAAAVRVVGWSTYVQTSGTPIYVPTILADLALTIGSSVPTLTIDGVSQYFFNTIVSGAGVPTVNVYSPGTVSGANDNNASAVIDTIGMQYVTLQFKGTNLNSPTMGAFYAFL
jgi:hypothetical protein